MGVELIGQVEAARVHHDLAYVATVRVHFPERGAEFFRLGAALCTWAGAGSPFNRVMGLGLDGAVTAAELDRVEAFFRRHAAPTVLDLSEHAQRSLDAVLRRHGYRAGGPLRIYLRRPHPADHDDEPDVLVRAVTAAQRSLWAATVSRGFADRDDVAADAIASVIVRIPDKQLFLAYLDGEAAGAASLWLDGPIAILGGASTRPGYRRRGVQTALLKARLAAAWTAGATLAMAQSDADTASERNLRRRGFELGYTTRAWRSGLDDSSPPT